MAASGRQGGWWWRILSLTLPEVGITAKTSITEINVSLLLARFLDFLRRGKDGVESE
jgi:hypothetical protein